MKRVSFAIVLVSLFTSLHAQEKEKNIEEVIIHGKFMSLPYKKVSENVTVITKTEIQNSPAKSIEEVLAQFTGLDIRRRGGNGVQADITLRGSTFEQVMIMVNGIRMNDSQTGHNSMNLPFDLASVERIEIIKGPAARKFGNNAYAGVINIVTKPSSEDNIIISAQGGDYETYSLGIGSNFGNEKFSNFIQANTNSSEGYRYNTDYKINNIYYQNQLNLQNGILKFQAGIQEKKFGANGFYSSPKATEQYEETQASIVSLAHQQKFGNFGLNSNVSWRRGQDMYLYDRNVPGKYKNFHLGNNIGAELNGSYTSSLGTSGLGVELRKEFFVSNNKTTFTTANLSMGRHERFVTQVFAEHHFSFFNEKLQIVPGISWASFSNAGNFFYPGIDVSFTQKDIKMYFNIAKVHRIPTYTDLFYISGTEVGNPNLKPENAVSSEAGLKYTLLKIDLKLSGFLRNTDDGIDWIKNSSSDKWTAQNIGKIDTKGIEFEANLKPVNWFFLGVGYTYIDNKFTKTTNFSKYALENLKHQLVARLQNNFGKFSNQLIYRYNERVSTGSYNVLDERLSYNLKNLNLYILVNNITNTNYTEAFGVPMPKRWFHVGFTYKIGL